MNLVWAGNGSRNVYGLFYSTSKVVISGMVWYDAKVVLLHYSLFTPGPARELGRRVYCRLILHKVGVGRGKKLERRQ
jgi:hypothetical protein